MKITSCKINSQVHFEQVNHRNINRIDLLHQKYSAIQDVNWKPKTVLCCLGTGIQDISVKKYTEREFPLKPGQNLPIFTEMLSCTNALDGTLPSFS